MSARTRRIQRRYQQTTPTISIERAALYTESWRRTPELPPALRVARAMRNVYDKVTILVDPDDRIAGHWTEHFSGVPIDIERGVFNHVLAAELSCGRLAWHRGLSALRAVRYLVRKQAVGEVRRALRASGVSGSPAMKFDLQTMAQRPVNPFRIEERDRRILQRRLLPFWRGRTLVDTLGRELAAAGLASPAMHDFSEAMLGSTSHQVAMISPCATIATMQGHVILDHGEVLERGLTGMLAKVRSAQRTLPAPDDEERTCLSSIELALEGVVVFARRLASQLERKRDAEPDPVRRGELAELHAVCDRVPLEPPRSFREAVQALWTVKTAVELAHPINLHCFGRLDQLLYPFYERDLEAGEITGDDACELLEELLLKIMSQNVRPESNLIGEFYHRYLGSSPVTLAGLKPDGTDGTNPLTYVFLRAAHRSRAVTNISVRIHPGSPPELLQAVAGHLHDGTSSFALYNDVTHLEAMKRRGFPEEDARDYAITGCVEAICPGKTGGMSASALLLCRLLDVTLRDGDARTLAGTLRGEGLRTGDPDRFSSFEELLDAFFAQASHFIGKIVEASNLRDRLFARTLPAPHISAFMQGCLERRRDVTRGGAVHELSGISMINSIANLVDSLLVIRQLVFEERSLGFAELLRAIDANFVGHEPLLRRIRGVQGKWGNGDPRSDELAGLLTRRLCELTHGHRSFKGGPFVVYLISMTTHTIDGRMSLATPDGRRAATPYAASGNPYNVDRSGVTATLRSVAALPFDDLLGAAINLKLHPSAIGATGPGRAKWAALIRTYFRLGGGQLQPTVASAELLHAAQRDPEAHRDLIVKVGGYSTYFVDLGREIQEEILSRTEHR